MLTQNHTPKNPPILQTVNDPHLEVNRLLATAVVNHQFQSKLLNEPSAALEGGYLDRSFSLTDEERDIILSIQTDSLQDFARKLLEAFKEQPVAIKQVSYAVVR